MPNAGAAALKHTIPVIDRTMEVLGQLERQGADGVTIRELTQKLSLPRTTVYRILNTLQSHDVVRRDDEGSYHLGRRLPAEDRRQIGRWKAMQRHVAQIRRNCEPGDLFCRPRQRQALLHWAYDSRKL